MLNKMVMAAALVFGVSAHAQSKSEFFYQTEAGKSDLTPKIGYLTSTTKGKGSTIERKANGLVSSGVAYEYGINDMFSLEGALYFASLENDATPKVKQSGLQDPQVTLKGTSPLAAGRLRFGMNMGLGFEKLKVKANGDMNAASGGFSFTPYIGMDMDAGGGLLGGRLAYLYKMDRTVEVEGSTSDSKIKDGNAVGLSVFYEGFAADMLLGGALNYASYAATKDEDGDTLTSSHNTLGASFYSRIPFESFSLIPRLDYTFSHSEADKYDIIVLSVAGRFTF